MTDADSMKLRILIVDDEAIVLRALERSLSGNTIFAAQSYAAADELLHQEAVDLVISDCAMPESSGVEVLRATATIQPTARRIMWSAHPPEDLEQLLREGLIQRFLPKPWIEELLAEVEAVRRTLVKH